jgi:hypothetical protein
MLPVLKMKNMRNNQPVSPQVRNHLETVARSQKRPQKMMKRRLKRGDARRGFKGKRTHLGHHFRT